MCSGEAALLSSCLADNKLEMNRFKAAESDDWLSCVHRSPQITDSMHVNFYRSIIESWYPSLKRGCGEVSSLSSKDKLLHGDHTAHRRLLASSKVHNTSKHTLDCSYSTRKPKPTIISTSSVRSPHSIRTTPHYPLEPSVNLTAVTIYCPSLSSDFL